MTRIILSGGGTAGHIHPALALGEELTARGVEVYFAGTPQGLEARLVQEAGFPFQPFEASGFDRSKPWSLLKGINSILASTKEAKIWFKTLKPDAVVGFGAYVSIPVARAAHGLDIPLIIHEQNSVMGMANRYLMKYASAVCLTYEQTTPKPPSTENVFITGNPVRRAVTNASREKGRQRFGIDDSQRLLLIFGGSLGARSINEAAVALKEELLSRDRWTIVQITGPKEFQRVYDELALTDHQLLRWYLIDYENAMGEVLAASDLIWSRAGASSLAEIAALALPALLVPYPYARQDHQHTNALSLAASGGAMVFADDTLNEPAFKHTLLSLMDDDEALEALKSAALKHPGSQAVKLLADVVIEAATRDNGDNS